MKSRDSDVLYARPTMSENAPDRRAMSSIATVYQPPIRDSKWPTFGPGSSWKMVKGSAVTGIGVSAGRI